MKYVVLILTAFTVTAQNIFKRSFTEKGKGSAFLFSAMVSFVAMTFFIATNTDWYYSIELLLPSFLFALTYAVASVFSVMAFLYGPLAKTTLIYSCSLLIPTLYGIIIQGKNNESATTPTLIIGIILLFCALFFVNYQKRDEGKITLKWIICVAMAFLCNGLCSVVQVAKQDFYGNEGNSMFMIVALFMVAIFLLCATFSIKEQRRYMGVTVKKGWLPGVLCGISNGATNFFIMFLNKSSVPASLTYPVMSGGGLILIFVYAILIKKERFTSIQYFGYGLGIVALILMNL